MKLKRIFALLICASVLCSCLFLYSACSPDDENSNLPEDNSPYNVALTVTATETETVIAVSSRYDGEEAKNAQILSVKAYEYLSGDSISGLSENIVAADSADHIVAEYNLGQTSEIRLPRYEAGYDNIYSKYYLVCDGEIIKGPVYTTETAAVSTAAPQLDIKSKKGMLGENAAAFSDLNCSYTVINLSVEKAIYPNELFEDGQEIPLAHPNDAYSFVSNGTTYYFNKSVIDSFDSQVKTYYKIGASVTAVLCVRNDNISAETFPEKMTYLPYSTQGTSLVSVNTSNSYGFSYYIALIEFLTCRYTQNGFPNGYIANYVVGNEIDYAKDYNRISEKQVNIDVYMEEYSRLLRLTNLAAKKYHKDITVCMPLTHNWAQRGYDLPLNAVGSYTPKTMVEWLNTKTKQEGDYDWGIAPHSYGSHLAQAIIFELDTFDGGDNITYPLGGRKSGMTGDMTTTRRITFSNLELLDKFISQDGMLVNGTTRPVYLTESGISSCGDSERERNQQAGAIAAVWYKVSQLDSVTAFSYYRYSDHADEAADKALFGLVDAEGNRKPAYNVFKYIDTQYSEKVAEDYLQYLAFYDADNNRQTTANGGITSYIDVLNIFDTGYDFTNFDWAKAKPVTCEPVFEYEDKINLDSVVFEDKSFFYDGSEKFIEASGLPEGVTVEYDVSNSRTEIGSTEIIATFKQNGETVGRRKATLTISRLGTNKTVYNLNEKIFVSAYRNGGDFTSDAWIGIFDRNAVPGAPDKASYSYYYYYFNAYGDTFTRTQCMQEGIYNTDKGELLTAGEYVIYFFPTGGYEWLYSVDIVILPDGQDSGSIDLSGVDFADADMVETGNSLSLTVSGTLPSGVSVVYENNTLTEVGSVEACAVFYYCGAEFERRYAVLNVTPAVLDRLVTNKTVYSEGEDIFVTAVAPSDAAAATWWVGLYLESDSYESDASIYWYYVVDSNHINGQAYNIREQSFNSTRADLADIPKGNYKMVLFNTGGYTVEKTVDITVIERETAGEGNISCDKTQYAAGETVMVTASCPDNIGSKIYWVGLYLKTDDVTEDKSIYWYYVKDEAHASGETYDIKQQTANEERADYGNLPAGEYKLVLFNSSGYTVEKEIYFTVLG